MELIPIAYPQSLDYLNTDFSKHHEIMSDIYNKMTSELNKKREHQILEILKTNGFEFKSRLEIENFMKQRCHLLSFTFNNRKVLNLDGRYLCEWDDTINIDNGDYTNAEIKIIVGI